MASVGSTKSLLTDTFRVRILVVGGASPESKPVGASHNATGVEG
jgi:hypothetical protein